MTLRVSTAALVDNLCPHCGSLEGVALAWRCPTCDADHVARICGECTAITNAGSVHAGSLDAEDRAELRRIAHSVAQVRRAA